MRVSDLEQFLASLTGPLSAGGAKKVADELSRMIDVLKPFREMTLPQFEEFLRVADEYRRTGVVPVSGRPKGGGGRSRAKPKDPAAVQDAINKMKTLYEEASSPETSYDEIKAKVDTLSQQFTKPQVVEIAQGMGIPGSFKTKKAAIEEIYRRIAGRKESYQRVQF